MRFVFFEVVKLGWVEISNNVNRLDWSGDLCFVGFRNVDLLDNV